MVRTLSRYRACRYLAYAAAFVLWAGSVAGQILVGAGRCCARNWREYAETVRDVENSHKPGGANSDWPDTQSDEVWCDKAPEGFVCLRDPGHDGPCAAERLFR